VLGDCLRLSRSISRSIDPEDTMRLVAPILRSVASGLAALTLLTGSGCARVSPQSVTLADTVGAQLIQLQSSHEAFVREAFDHSREGVERFLADRWIPHFLERLTNDADGAGTDLITLVAASSPFDDQQIERLETAFREHGISDTTAARAATTQALGGGERGEVVLAFAEAAVGEIETKRRALLDPIDALERQTLAELRAVYSQVISAQNTLSAHLHSLVEVQAGQDRLLERAGLLDQRDEMLRRALAANDRVGNVLDTAETIDQAITTLMNDLGTWAAADREP
jgi:hypothetical protein